MKTNEAEIVNNIRSGADKEAILYLYKSVFPLVKRYVRQRAGTQEEAYDVFQDSLLELYQIIINGQFQEKFTVTGYLYRMCTYKWLNKSKRDQKIEYKEELQDINMNETQVPVIFDFVNSSNENVLQQYFGEIGNKCVELLTNTIILEHSLEETMHKMDFPSIGSVKMQHKRCKEKMIALLDKYPQIIEKLRDQING